MNLPDNSDLRNTLKDRRGRLAAVVEESGGNDTLRHLLNEVDAALEKYAQGTYGLCETCHDPIERDRLMVNPLIRNCLDHLTAAEQRVLEQDLDLAFEVQRNLLPRNGLVHGGWATAYHYEPAGPVSGDYCDLIVNGSPSDPLHFVIGDATGKGVAASLMMTHLHGIFRILTRSPLPLQEMMNQANRLFCEATLSLHFATVVSGKGDASGNLELANAGHCYPFIMRRNGIERVQSHGVPLGLFCDSAYMTERYALAPGETVFLFTDGVSEARNAKGETYGEDRLAELLSRQHSSSAQHIVDAVREELRSFLDGAPLSDDITVVALQRSAPGAGA
ncbi:MAG: SpoIIE family protein phosphatase [Bacteroidota bacterium]